MASRVWRQRDFLRLWTGETISLFGSQITALALPLTASAALHATAGQMGLLAAAQFAPYLLFSLLAGVWVDRVRRRPLMIAADLGQVLLLVMVPMLAGAGMLHMSHLYLIGFASGSLTVLFDLAWQAYLPSLVGREGLVEANSILQASSSATAIAGPGLGGFLIQLVTAPVAMVVDAGSYLVSAISLLRIRQTEPGPVDATVSAPKPSFWFQIKEGVSAVLKHETIRALAAEAACFNGFNQAIWAVMVLFLTREVGLQPGALGLVFGMSSAGSMAGALAAGPLGARWGVGRTTVGSMAVACTAPLLILFAAWLPVAAVPLLVVSFFLNGLGITVSNVHVVSLRQALIPEEMFGRVNAAYRFFVTGVCPLGALLGGAAGDLFGLRAGLAVGALGLVAAPLWVFFSPVVQIRELPDTSRRRLPA